MLKKFHPRLILKINQWNKKNSTQSLPKKSTKIFCCLNFDESSCLGLIFPTCFTHFNRRSFHAEKLNYSNKLERSGETWKWIKSKALFQWERKKSTWERINLAENKLQGTTYCCCKQLSYLNNMSTALNFQAFLVMAENPLVFSLGLVYWSCSISVWNLSLTITPECGQKMVRQLQTQSTFPSEHPYKNLGWTAKSTE